MESVSQETLLLLLIKVTNVRSDVNKGDGGLTPLLEGLTVCMVPGMLRRRKSLRILRTVISHQVRVCIVVRSSLML